MEEHGVSFAEAREQVLASTVFTTHTPVPAGNEMFATELMRKYLSKVAEKIGLPWQEFLGMGQLASAKTPDFGLTVLALRSAAHANGVSRLHAETSRKMWKDLWPGAG
jgi:starch phosphorylase